MQAPIPPQGAAPAAPAPGQPPAQGGGLKADIAQAHDLLSKITEFMTSQDPAAGQAMAGVLQGFEGIADGLGQPQGPQPGAAPGGPVPAEAGAKEVRPVL